MTFISLMAILSVAVLVVGSFSDIRAGQTPKVTLFTNHLKERITKMTTYFGIMAFAATITAIILAEGIYFGKKL